MCVLRSLCTTHLFWWPSKSSQAALSLAPYMGLGGCRWASCYSMGGVNPVCPPTFFIQAGSTRLGPIVPWFSSFLIDFLMPCFSSLCPCSGNSIWLPSEVPGKRRSCGHGISEGAVNFGKLLILWPRPVNYQWSDVWEPQAVVISV